MKQGEVILVGAGPGDPELLTEKAIRYIQCADVIVYDALACPSVLNLAKPSCQLIYAGKHAGQHSMRQEETNRLLAKLHAGGAAQGRRPLCLWQRRRGSRGAANCRDSLYHCSRCIVLL